MAKRFPKRKAQTLHALKRADQRYDLDLSPKDLGEIKYLIQSGNSRFLKKLSNSRTKHSVIYQDQLLIVVWDKTRHQICTFLPAEN